VSWSITLGGEAHLIRYNNLSPIVVNAPEGVEVRHLWTAGAETKVVEKG
jgi:serine protease inhibitor ecotin